MYDYINHEMKATKINHGYLVAKPDTKSSFEYGHIAEAIQSAMITHQGRLDQDEYIMICRSSKCIRVCKHFNSVESARQYAKANRVKHYLCADTWLLHPASLRVAVLDLLFQ